MAAAFICERKNPGDYSPGFPPDSQAMKPETNLILF